MKKLSGMSIILIIIAASLILGVFVREIWGNSLDAKDIITIILTAVFGLATMYYANQTHKLEKLISQINRVNFRPYIQIKGGPLPGDVINPPPNARSTEAFYFARNDANDEFFEYSISNQGNVAAHILSHEVKVFEESNNGDVREIMIPNDILTRKEVLFPKTEHKRRVPLGKNIRYRNVIIPAFLHLKLKVIYQGPLEIGSTKYFSFLELRSPISLIDSGVIQTIDEDEGTEN